jgi:hypothetical protein
VPRTAKKAGDCTTTFSIRTAMTCAGKRTPFCEDPLSADREQVATNHLEIIDKKSKMAIFHVVF